MIIWLWLRVIVMGTAVEIGWSNEACVSFCLRVERSWMWFQVIEEEEDESHGLSVVNVARVATMEIDHTVVSDGEEKIMSVCDGCLRVRGCRGRRLGGSCIPVMCVIEGDGK